MTSAAVFRIIPHPVHQERQIEPLRAPRPNIISLAPVVPNRTPDRARKIYVSRKIEPDDGFCSGQAKIKMGRVVAVNNPRVAGSHFLYLLTKSLGLGLHPARVPIDCVKMHDRKPETLTDSTRQRRLAGPTRSKNENALRQHGC